MSVSERAGVDDLYADLRPLAFSIAYRMLGSVSEAEDVVQEAFLRLHRAQEGGERIESPRAYIATLATRLSIDELRSARVRRESYVGEWLPEPLVTEGDEPSRQAETADSLSLALLVVLESLSPLERAVFLLREVFDYGYAEIAGIVDRSEAACRQLSARARRRVEERKPRFEASRREREELAKRFFAAAEEGDTDGLVELLAADAVVYGDGGGKVPALARPVYGRERVARLLVSWMKLGRKVGGRFEPTEVNGQPGAMALAPDGRVAGVMSVDIVDGAVTTVRSVVNPEKLGHLGEVADLGELLAGARKRGGAD